MSRTILSCLGLGMATAAAAGTVVGLTGSLSPELMTAATIAGGMAGNFATDLCKILYRPVAAQWLEGRAGINENHYVANALRLAQLDSLRLILARSVEVNASDWDDARRRGAERLYFRLEQFLDTQTETVRLGPPDTTDIGADEARIRDEVLASLPDVFDRSLAARRADGDMPSLRESLAKLRAATETAVLAELRLHIDAPDRNLPPAFVGAFEGAGFPDSWFDLFVRDAASRLKEDAGLERVWNAEQLAAVKAIVTAERSVLDEVNERTKCLEQGQARAELSQADQTAMLRELLERARSGDVFSRAAEQGIPEAAVRSIIQRLGGEGIAHEDLIPWLDAWIETAREELGRRTNNGEAFEAARREADQRFRAGQLQEASAAFMEELEREDRLEAGRQAERKQYRIRLLEEAIRFDELAFNIPALVSKLRMMMRTSGITDPDARSSWQQRKAYEYYERGRDEGVNTALTVAVVLLREVLQELTRERFPIEWAKVQNNLAAALQALGERQGRTARLEEAAAAYRDALHELTRERVPLNWAMIQNNLGVTLRTLGERERGTARLEEAVIAFRYALQERTRKQVPLDWAATQNNLGNALLTLGRRESGTARLEEAIAVYRDALKERTRKRVPLKWAMTQDNLGNALRVFGERGHGTVHIEEAVAAYRGALEERTRERVPLDWAATQDNLGSALAILGERENSTERLEKAITAYREALQERTRKRTPLDWAMTQNNLGNALQSLGTFENDAVRVQQAVDAYRNALQEWTRERVPLEWAATQNNLGNALSTLGERESGTIRLEEAIVAYRVALQERTRERVPLHWAATKRNLGIALSIFGERESGTARLEEAVSAWNECLEVTATVWPSEWLTALRSRQSQTVAEIYRRSQGGA